MQTLTTPRLTLRPWQPDDADAVLDIYSRWDVMRFIGVTPRVLEHRDEALERVERWVAADDGTHGVWAVVPRAGEGTGLPDAAPVGTILLKPIPASGRPVPSPARGTTARTGCGPSSAAAQRSTRSSASSRRSRTRGVTPMNRMTSQRE